MQHDANNKLLSGAGDTYRPPLLIWIKSCILLGLIPFKRECFYESIIFHRLHFAQVSNIKMKMAT